MKIFVTCSSDEEPWATALIHDFPSTKLSITKTGRDVSSEIRSLIIL